MMPAKKPNLNTTESKTMSSVRSKKPCAQNCLNRIDKIVVFRPLGMEEIKKIANLELSKLAEHVKKQQNITLNFDKM